MAENKNNNKYNPHKGHRQNVRERYYQAGFKGMADHNILELLLFAGIPQRDTNPIAHNLIDTFGNFSSVFEANVNDLKNVKGMTESAACLISMILPTYSAYCEDLYRRKPKPLKPCEIATYLRPKFFSNGCREAVYVLCYDNNINMIGCRLLCEGDFKSARFSMRDLAKIVLETNCSYVTISHNHPHGIILPSNDDIQTTTRVIEFLAGLKVKVLDHIIVSDADYISLANYNRTMEIFTDRVDFDTSLKKLVDYNRNKRKEKNKS